MSKHGNVAIGGGDLLDMIQKHTDSHWTEVLGINCDCDGTCKCLHKVTPGWWLVKWPDHVSLPRYNSDATYIGPMTEAEARVDADGVYGER